MKNQIEKVFNYENIQVRTVIENGEVWFVGKDVCDVLEISNYRKALQRLEEDERVSLLVHTLGGKQKMVALNEPGLYRLIFTSNKPEAEKFKRWVFHDVLPSIRKTGYYILPKSNNIYPLLVDALGEEEADKIKDLNQTSVQVMQGFAFHDDSYTTFDEIESIFGVKKQWLINELMEKGYLKEEFCKRGQYGVRYQKYIYRLSKAGGRVGEETLNKRKETSLQPFSFRWKKSFVLDLIAIYLPMFDEEKNYVYGLWKSEMGE